MNHIRKGLKENSSLILTVGTGVGILTTAYLAGKASFAAARVLDREDPYLDPREKVKLVWRLYIPTGASAAATIVCVAGVRHVDARKVLAGQTALAVSQRAYEGYREQVIAELGDKKDQLFVAKATEKRINEGPPPVIVAGSGSVLCYEAYSGRYFMSDMETLNRAVNEINSKLNKHDYATLDDFYYLIDLENTMSSGQSGWESAKLMELEYSSVLHKGKPCLAFSYNYVMSF